MCCVWKDLETHRLTVSLKHRQSYTIWGPENVSFSHQHISKKAAQTSLEPLNGVGCFIKISEET